MRKRLKTLLLAVTLLGLLGSCVRPSQVVRTPPPECKVTAWPPNPQITGDGVHDAVAVGLWARAIERIHDDLTTCPNITWIPDAPTAR